MRTTFRSFRSGLRTTTALALLAVAGLGLTRDALADDWVETARAHYERVEQELRRADVTHLTAEQRVRRAELIDELARYHRRGEFGRHELVPGARIPQFVDADGTHCAVANLLRARGRTDLVERVRLLDNEAYVSDLATDADLGTWLDSVGLTLEEAVRIQFPGVIRDTPTTDGRDPNVGPDTGGPDTGDPSRGGPATGPDTGSGPSTGGAGRGVRAGSGGGLPADWRVWWELQKLSWFDVNPLHAADGDYAVGAEDRARVAPLLEARLTDPDAAVRGAAAVAYARVRGPGATEALIGLFDDPQQSVRERALVALGATGSDAGVERLLATARPKNARARRAAEDVSPDARSLAIVGLAVARAYGFEQDLGASAIAAFQDAKKRDVADLGTAVLSFHRISPDERVPALARATLDDDNAPVELRSHAVEGLLAETDAKTLRVLQRLHEGRHVDLRRAASVALGRTDHDLALPRMMSAFEAEKEPLTRGLTLVSIARQGGDAARSFVAEQLEDGPITARPWAALALGVLARDGDSEASKLLREAELGDRDLGAKAIALGLSRDPAALAFLREELTEAGSPSRRAYAASGLALLGTDAARFALLECLENESSELVRANAAQGLGSMGHAEDASFLLRELRRAPSGPLQAVTAAGVGFHGSADAVDGLVEMLGDDSLSASGRAAVVQALGILLDRRPGLLFPAIGRDTNFTALPDWALRVLRMTL